MMMFLHMPVLHPEFPPGVRLVLKVSVCCSSRLKAPWINQSPLVLLLPVEHFFFFLLFEKEPCVSQAVTPGWFVHSSYIQFLPKRSCGSQQAHQFVGNKRLG